MVDERAKKNFADLWSFILPYRALVMGILLLVIFMVALELGVAWMIKEMTDRAIEGQLTEVLKFFSIGLGLFFLTGLNNFAKTFLTGKVAEETVRDIKESTYRHIQRLPVNFYEKGRSGDLLSHFSNDINMLLEAMKYHFIPLLENPLMALFSFIFLFFINWKLALICVATGPLTYFVGKYFSPLIMRVSRRVQESIGENNAFLSESLQGIHVVKSFGLEEEFQKKHEEHISKIYQGSMKRTLFESFLNGISFFVGSLSFMLTFGFGVVFIIYDQLTVGELWAFIQLVNRVIWPFSGLARIWGSFTSSLSAGGRIFNLYAIHQEKVEGAKKDLKEIQEGRIEYHDVCFAYQEGKDILKGITFSTQPGEIVAFVGLSGSGKSTIFKLLLGFYSPDQGQIIIDGEDIKNIGIHELRKNSSFVSQDIYLFHGSIRDNIRYGRLDATQEEIEQAAKEANIHDFISNLPQGYETMVGERGVNLSGGEKQRISIARALLRDAKILLLDEPTSSLDSVSEELVQEALGRLMEGKTTLVIAHRLSTVIAANKIIVIHEGRIEATNTHNVLLEKSPTYKKLFKVQFKKSEVNYELSASLQN